MDVSAVATAANQFSAAQVGDGSQTLVLKKALDVEAQTAAALIDAVPQPSATLPSHLGQNINTTA